MNAATETSSRTSPFLRLLGLGPRQPRKAAPAAAKSPQPDLPPPAPDATRILIVDDDPLIRKTSALKLGRHGYNVLTACDGAAAIKMVRTLKPDLILLDISFPPDVAHGGNVPWDGFRLISWLRRMPEAQTIPVIMITGCDPEEYQQRSLAAGAMAFFHKPIDHDGLLSVIDKALSPSPDAKTPAPGTDFAI